MGAAESKPAVVLRTDIQQSTDAWLNSLYRAFIAHQTEGTPLSAELTAAIEQLSHVSHRKKFIVARESNSNVSQLATFFS